VDNVDKPVNNYYKPIPNVDNLIHTLGKYFQVMYTLLHRGFKAALQTIAKVKLVPKWQFRLLHVEFK
jgi:hypothetical protein